MPQRERQRRDDPSESGRGRSRNRTPAGREKGERNNEKTRRSHSSSPTPRRRYSRSIQRSQSRSRSPRRRRKSRSPKSGKERRSRSRSRSRERRRRRRSRSSSSLSSDRSERHRKKRKEKERKRSRSRDKKDKKNKKKDKKKKEKSALTAQWGKYGIINESNMYDKEAEFRTWLVEERMINPETLSRELTKKEFAKFVEDYNTATLPHEKYYNMDAFEKRMSAVRNGELLTIPDDAYDPNADLAAHSNAHKRASASKNTYLSKEELQELRRVQAERTQVGKMKLMGMDIKQNFGVRMDGSSFDE